MATYCIGDLHGRYDLFMMMLKKIQFDSKQDHIYLLGDVIDRDGKEGIKIIDYVMEHSDSITLLRGNHENDFLQHLKHYDVIMNNPHIKFAAKEVVYNYSSTFDEIQTSFENGISYRSKDHILYSSKISKWLTNGNTGIRKKMLDAMLTFIEAIDYDKKIYESFRIILSNISGQHKTKNFVKELLDISTDKYIVIKKYISNLTEEQHLNINGRHFVLSHFIYDNFNNSSTHYIRENTFRHIDADNTYCIFGHTPIPRIHSYLQNKKGTFFDFNYRKVFSYIDIHNNRYYNLDTGSDPIVALKLDNFNEYYVASEKVPSDLLDDITEIKNDYFLLEQSFFHYSSSPLKLLDSKIAFSKRSKKGYAFVTIKDNCYEYIIGVYKSENLIIYSRADWLDFNEAFVISNWYTGQSNEEIISKVTEDYTVRFQSGELQSQYNILCGKI